MSSDKFKELAEKRTNNAIKQIKLIGNLANPSNYDYSDAQVKKIISALNDEIAATSRKFELATSGRVAEKFSL
jgi:hypothetical protein